MVDTKNGTGDGSSAEPKPGTIGDAGKFLSAGFATLTAVLTWFGVSGGVLNRMLLQFPRAVLFSFVPVGLGVLGSLCATMLGHRPSATWLVAPVVFTLGLVLVSTWWFPDLVVRPVAGRPGDAGDRSVGMIVGLVAAVVVLIGGCWLLERSFRAARRRARERGEPDPDARRRVGGGAVMMLLAVVSYAFGMYGAVKLTVVSKHYSQPFEAIASSAATDDPAWTTVSVAVAGGQFRPSATIHLMLRAGDTDVASTYLAAGVGGDVPAKTLSFRVPSSVDSIEVLAEACIQVFRTSEIEASEGETVHPATMQTWELRCGGEEAQSYGAVRIAGEPAVVTPVLAAGLAGSGGAATATVTGSGLTDGGLVMVTMTMNGVEQASATVRPAADGTLTWVNTISASPMTTVQVVATYSGDPEVVASATTRVPPVPASGLP